MNSVERLMKRLHGLGFGNMFEKYSNWLSRRDAQFYELFHQGEVNRNTYFFTASVVKTHRGFDIFGYELAVRKHFDIRPGIFNGVNTRQLDAKMAAVNWQKREYEPYMLDSPDNRVVESSPVKEIIHDVSLLYQHKGIGRDIAERLQANHWMGTRFNVYIPHFDRLRKRYEVSVRVPIGPAKQIPVKQALYDLVKTADANKLEQDKRSVAILKQYLLAEKRPANGLLVKKEPLENGLKLHR